MIQCHRFAPATRWRGERPASGTWAGPGDKFSGLGPTPPSPSIERDLYRSYYLSPRFDARLPAHPRPRFSFGPLVSDGKLALETLLFLPHALREPARARLSAILLAFAILTLSAATRFGLNREESVVYAPSQCGRRWW